jgi:geranylgeranylglycerol-phosphate geranylgeranyltransferase
MENLWHNYTKKQEKSAIIEYAGYLLHYIKKRNQVYIFALTSLLSLAIASNGNIEPSIALRLLFGTYTISLATYIYNDLYDVRADRLNKVNRLVVNGYADVTKLIRLIASLFIVGLLLLVSINIYTVVISCICSLLAIAYSHRRFNLKDKFPHKTIINALGASLAALIGGFAVENVSISVLILSVVSFLFLFILAPLGDLQDYKGDMLAGKRTMPIVLGVNNTLNVMMLIPIGIICIFIFSKSISMLGTLIVLSTNSLVVLLLYYIKRHYSIDIIKRSRHVLRLAYMVNQLSMLVGSS